MPDAPKTLGAHHIGLTVPDVERTRNFFVDVLGFSQVGERPHYPAIFVSDGRHRSKSGDSSLHMRAAASRGTQCSGRGVQ